MEFSFILVEPANPGNVGSAVRAINTMGFRSIRLINPCDFLSSEARKMAYGSHDLLESSTVFESMEDAVDDLDFVIGTTAKKRTVWNDYLTPGECTTLLKEKGNTILKVGIVFGREESGLTTSELELCDIRSTIPLSAPYPSVNLAQSVMIYAYEFSGFILKNNPDKAQGIDVAEQRVLKEKALEIIEILDIKRNENLSRRIMERLLLSSGDDIHLFLSFHQFLKRYIDDK